MKRRICIQPNSEEQRTLRERDHLMSTTFTVIDLETTGGSPTSGARITEVGAVKVHRGEVLGEFSTLVDPGCPIPPSITALTGITDCMVTGAPTMETVLPTLMEFMADTVLVAHNAPFDIGFLMHCSEAQGRPWPRLDVLDTVLLARRVIDHGETPNFKLASLATLFGSPVSPNHRALDDAHATAHVLHELLKRVSEPEGPRHRHELQTST